MTSIGSSRSEHSLETYTTCLFVNFARLLHFVASRF